MYFLHVYSSSKLEKGIEQVLPGSKGGWEGEEGGRVGKWPKNVCTYE
jgi:hypothetical protein